MLPVDPVALDALDVHLAKADTALKAVSGTINEIEIAGNASKKTERQIGREVLRLATEEREKAMLDREEAVREALYGPDVDDHKGRCATQNAACVIPAPTFS